MDTITVNVSPGYKARREILGGREYLVAPMTMIVPGVLSGNQGPMYYPPDEIARNPTAWENVPITIYHPSHNGEAVRVSDGSPVASEILASSGVGIVRNPSVDQTGKLRAEGWFDVQNLKRVDKRGNFHLYDRLVSGKRVELSTGLDLDREPVKDGTSNNGRVYHSIARNYRPDHLAVLPDRPGACSVKDGCGIFNQGAPGLQPLSAVVTNDPLTINPLVHEHSARVASPGSFVEGSFRRKKIASGVSIIIAKRKLSGAMEVQAYRFDTEKFTAAEAREWLKEHKVDYLVFEKAKKPSKTRENSMNKMKIWSAIGEALGMVGHEAQNGSKVPSGSGDSVGVEEIDVLNEPSHTDLNSQISHMLRNRYAKDEDGRPTYYSCYVMDVYDDHVVFVHGDTTYSLGYEIVDDVVRLSEDEPTEVVRVTQYKPIDNLATNATKKEGKETLSAKDYAYVPDPDKPSTWKLRIDDAAHVSAACAALSPGGFRGNRVRIPKEDLPAVKRKLRAAWKKFYPGKDPDDMPMSIRNQEGDQPADNELNHSEGGSTMPKLTAEQRDQVINALVANCNCQQTVPWKGKDKATLSALSDETLSIYDEWNKSLAVTNVQTPPQYVPPPVVGNGQPPAPPAPVGTAPPGVPVAAPIIGTTKPKSMTEALEMYGTPQEKTVWNSVMEQHQKAKQELIERLTSHLSDEVKVATQQIYNNMDPAQLSVLAAAHQQQQKQPEPAQPPIMNFFGGIGGPAQQKPVQEEVLPAPVYNFSTTGKSRKTA